MTDPAIDDERLREHFEAFSEIGATPSGGVARPALTDANKQARDTLVEWFEAAGLDVTVDEMGNVFGRRPGSDPDADPVLLGSHVDSQFEGGRYDGVVGVLGGLAVVWALNEAGVRTDHPIEVVAWTNEEGVRFQPDLLGSGVFAGAFDLAEAYAATDSEGRTLEAELERIGYKGETPCEPRDLAGYLELHVEQGPVLADAGRAVAAVDGVYGFTWLRATLEGQADHAGPTPMDARRDALVGASDAVTAVRRVTATAGEDVVATVGSLEVEPNGINVIPETVEFTVDLRSANAPAIDEGINRIREEIEWAARREGLDRTIEEVMTVPPTDFDPAMVERVEAAARAAGYDPLRLVSGAGHDASYLDRLCPTGMLFVPSEEGVSHRPSEFTDWADVVAGVEVLLEATLRTADG